MHSMKLTLIFQVLVVDVVPSREKARVVSEDERPVSMYTKQ